MAGPHPIKNLVTSNTILYCRKWDATIRFYRDGLQLPVIFATNWFVEFGLTASSRLSIADEKHAAIKSCGNAGITVALQVRDIEAAREYLEQMDLKPTVIKQHPWDALVFHVFDPEGHRIEMWQSLISDDIRDLNQIQYNRLVFVGLEKDVPEAIKTSSQMHAALTDLRHCAEWGVVDMKSQTVTDCMVCSVIWRL